MKGIKTLLASLYLIATTSLWWMSFMFDLWHADKTSALVFIPIVTIIFTVALLGRMIWWLCEKWRH